MNLIDSRKEHKVFCAIFSRGNLKNRLTAKEGKIEKNRLGCFHLREPEVLGSNPSRLIMRFPNSAGESHSNLFGVFGFEL